MDYTLENESIEVHLDITTNQDTNKNGKYTEPKSSFTHVNEAPEPGKNQFGSLSVDVAYSPDKHDEESYEPLDATNQRSVAIPLQSGEHMNETETDALFLFSENEAFSPDKQDKEPCKPRDATFKCPIAIPVQSDKQMNENGTSATSESPASLSPVNKSFKPESDKEHAVDITPLPMDTEANDFNVQRQRVKTQIYHQEPAEIAMEIACQTNGNETSARVGQPSNFSPVKEVFESNKEILVDTTGSSSQVDQLPSAPFDYNDQCPTLIAVDLGQHGKNGNSAALSESPASLSQVNETREPDKEPTVNTTLAPVDTNSNVERVTSENPHKDSLTGIGEITMETGYQMNGNKTLAPPGPSASLSLVNEPPEWEADLEDAVQW